MRQITFLTYAHESGHLKTFKTLVVDTDKLSPTAKIIANTIITTDRRDDFSRFYLQKPTTHEQDLISECVSSEHFKESIRRAKIFMGDSWLQTREVFEIQWGFLSRNKTPEQYLEEYARWLRKNGYILLGNPWKQQGFTPTTYV